MRIQPSAPTAIHNTPASSHLPTSNTPFSALVSPKSAATPATPAGSSTGATPAVSSSSGASTGGSADTGDVQSALDQSQDQNMQFLQLQSQMNTQSEGFTTLSNVMKTENDTIRNTAGNMQI